MDNTEQLIAIYHTGFIVCSVLLVVGIALAVLFFFKFDIRTIYLLRTGKAKQQTINEMKERNLKTGKLSASSPYTDSGDLKRKEVKRKTGSFRITNPKPAKAVKAGGASPSPETILAGPAPETAVLQSQSGVPESASIAPQKIADPLETAMLANSRNDSVPVRTSPTFRFTLTERTIVSHTTETI